MGRYYWQGPTLIQAWRIDHRHGGALDLITYPFLNFNGRAAVPSKIRNSYFTPRFLIDAIT